ncbi:YlxR family protein [Winkia neuii]|uniref:YlxR family protein n=1 Tax=Winkia neuii subsp. anitrata TaxID=29318 RepID=A0AB38XLW1_9ACTO|nr:YlxR family protein [Winkia neuii]MDU2269006.1 YlxR family protein [Winkia neuii]PLB81392.1 DUF448 domain-containing protein [Actinomyces sp. UMB0138]WCE45352.1 YlxR family protein [Winkia neuii subsp. anitrata]WEB56193.1 YlxR family protein [Winkia neuii]
MTAKLGRVCIPADGAPRKRDRTCVGCRSRDSRDRMVRLVQDGKQAVVCSPVAHSGRGAWIHPDPMCLQRAVKTGAIPRALRTAVKVDSRSLGLQLWANQEGTQGGKVLGSRDESGLEADGHPMSTQR